MVSAPFSTRSDTPRPARINAGCALARLVLRAAAPATRLCHMPERVAQLIAENRPNGPDDIGRPDHRDRRIGCCAPSAARGTSVVASSAYPRSLSRCGHKSPNSPSAMNPSISSKNLLGDGLPNGRSPKAPVPPTAGGFRSGPRAGDGSSDRKARSDRRAIPWPKHGRLAGASQAAPPAL